MSSKKALPLYRLVLLADMYEKHVWLATLALTKKHQKVRSRATSYF